MSHYKAEEIGLKLQTLKVGDIEFESAIEDLSKYTVEEMSDALRGDKKSYAQQLYALQVHHCLSRYLCNVDESKIKCYDSLINALRILAMMTAYCEEDVSIECFDKLFTLLKQDKNVILQSKILLLIHSSLNKNPDEWQSLLRERKIIDQALQLFYVADDLQIADTDRCELKEDCLVFFEGLFVNQDLLKLDICYLNRLLGVVCQCFAMLDSVQEETLKVQILEYMHAFVANCHRHKVFENEIYDFLTSGFFHSIVPYLRFFEGSEKFDLCEGAVSVFGDLCLWNEWKKEITLTGFLSYVPALLRANDSKLVRVVLWVLANLFADEYYVGQATMELLIKATVDDCNLLPILCFHMTGTDFDCRVESFKILTSLITFARFCSRKDIFNYEFIWNLVTCVENLQPVQSEFHEYLTDYMDIGDILTEFLNPLGVELLSSLTVNEQSTALIKCGVIDKLKAQVEILGSITVVASEDGERRDDIVSIFNACINMAEHFRDHKSTTKDA